MIRPLWNPITLISRWWHRREALRWQQSYITALGRRTEIEKGRDGFMWRMAVVDEHLCEQEYRRHAEKAGLTT